MSQADHPTPLPQDLDISRSDWQLTPLAGRHDPGSASAEDERVASNSEANALELVKTLKRDIGIQSCFR